MRLQFPPEVKSQQQAYLTTRLADIGQRIGDDAEIERLEAVVQWAVWTLWCPELVSVIAWLTWEPGERPSQVLSARIQKGVRGGVLEHRERRIEGAIDEIDLLIEEVRSAQPDTPAGQTIDHP